MVRLQTGNNMSHLDFSNGSALHLHKNNDDYTSINTTFIVNPAKPALLGGGGLDKVIHKKGGSAIKEACKKIPTVARDVRCSTGDARITKSGKLRQVAVIHTVGPNLKKHHGKPTKTQKKELRNAYQNSLKIADMYANYVKTGTKPHNWLDKVQADASKVATLKRDLNAGKAASITLCCISTGSYSFPVKKAAKIAVKCIAKFVKNNPNSALKEFHISCRKNQDDIKPLDKAMKQAYKKLGGK